MCVTYGGCERSERRRDRHANGSRRIVILFFPVSSCYTYRYAYFTNCCVSVMCVCVDPTKCSFNGNMYEYIVYILYNRPTGSYMEFCTALYFPTLPFHSRPFSLPTLPTPDPSPSTPDPSLNSSVRLSIHCPALPCLVPATYIHTYTIAVSLCANMYIT